MKTFILVASLALLTSVPASASPPQTYSRTIVTDRATQQNVDDFHIQPGAASSATGTVGAYRATATSDFGVIKLSADSPDANGFVQATGYFRDTITLSSTGAGGFVPVTMNFLVNGAAANYNPGVGEWAYGVILDLSGTDVNRFQYVSTDVRDFTSATGAFTRAITATGFAPAGVPLDITAVFSIYTSGNTFSAFNLDFAHTALLTGIAVGDGVTVTSATYGLLPTNAGQFTYGAVLRELNPGAPPAAVPEPASWALMIVGFGMVGGLMRSRRALVPDAAECLIQASA